MRAPADEDLGVGDGVVVDDRRRVDAGALDARDGERRRSETVVVPRRHRVQGSPAGRSM
jgi:hypothetical protein